MKFKEKLKIDIRFIFLLLSIISIIIFFQYSPKNEFEIDNKDDWKKSHEDSLRTSAIYPISPIWIDDTNPSFDWETFSSTYSGELWFSGNGTESNPYKIDNVLINGGSSCILIANSEVHFMIINSELTTAYPNQGIYLQNVTNGRVINSEIVLNEHGGMILIDCEEIVVAGSIITNCSPWGVKLDNSHNNIIFNNTLKNSYTGMVLEYSDDNEISENIVKDNQECGFSLWYSNNNTIKANTIKNNGIVDEFGGIIAGAGITINTYCSQNNITENKISNNKFCGIELSTYSGNTIISGNTLKNNRLCGIFLSETTDNNITGNLFTGEGIIFDGTWADMESNNITSTNLANDRPFYYYTNRENLKSSDFDNGGQTILIKCENSSISTLNASQGSIGITLISCKNITLSNSHASNNILYGIYLVQCNNNTIIGNTANSNGECGIILDSTFNNRILDNVVNENKKIGNYWYSPSELIYDIGSGIYLETGNSNKITGNTANQNEAHGVFLRWCSSLISENEVSNNDVNGIVLEFSGGQISENIVNYNAHHGIYLDHCSSVVILGNNINHQSGSGNSLDYVGVYIDHGSSNDIIDNDIISNEMGIYIFYSNGNNVSKNHLDDNGIFVSGDSNTISENIISNGVSGLDLINSDNNLISNNTFNSVYYVIDLISSDYNNISGNIIHGSGGVGLEFVTSSYNTIEGNDIRGCAICFREDDSCISNVFIDNTCVESGSWGGDIIIYIVIGCALGGAVIAVVLIKKRLGKKRL